MNLICILPFSYFFITRLRGGSFLFHLLFEWGAAFVLVLYVGSFSPLVSLSKLFFCYIAFISIYELGYFFNDLYSAPREADGRERWHSRVTRGWVFAWIAARVLSFTLMTLLLGFSAVLNWWLFYLTLIIVFLLHNLLVCRELKVVTFSWLAFYRFIAPIIFVVAESQRLGIALAVAMIYVPFRQFAYMDSKGLLSMPKRKSFQFRRFFYLLPLISVIALWPYSGVKGFVALVVYWACIPAIATLLPRDLFSGH